MDRQVLEPLAVRAILTGVMSMQVWIRNIAYFVIRPVMELHRPPVILRNATSMALMVSIVFIVAPRVREPRVVQVIQTSAMKDKFQANDWR